MSEESYVPHGIWKTGGRIQDTPSRALPQCPASSNQAPPPQFYLFPVVLSIMSPSIDLSTGGWGPGDSLTLPECPCELCCLGKHFRSKPQEQRGLSG